MQRRNRSHLPCSCQGQPTKGPAAPGFKVLVRTLGKPKYGILGLLCFNCDRHIGKPNTARIPRRYQQPRVDLMASCVRQSSVCPQKLLVNIVQLLFSPLWDVENARCEQHGRKDDGV